MQPTHSSVPAQRHGALDARATGVMLLLCLLWSLQQISLKAVADEASPMLVVALRSGIALVLLAALMARRGEAPQRARYPAGALVGALFGLEFVLVTTALGLTQASHVIVFLYTSPIFAALGLQVRLPAAWLVDGWRFVPSPAVWSHLAFQGVVVSFASFLAWFWLLRRYLASQLGVFSFLTPLFGVLLGVWLLGEALAPRFVAGGGLVLAGIALVGGHAALARRLAAVRGLAAR